MRPWIQAVGRFAWLGYLLFKVRVPVLVTDHEVGVVPAVPQLFDLHGQV
jgi:hypothetical protein